MPRLYCHHGHEVVVEEGSVRPVCSLCGSATETGGRADTRGSLDVTLNIGTPTSDLPGELTGDNIVERHAAPTRTFDKTGEFDPADVASGQGGPGGLATGEWSSADDNPPDSPKEMATGEWQVPDEAAATGDWGPPSDLSTKSDAGMVTGDWGSADNVANTPSEPTTGDWQPGGAEDDDSPPRVGRTQVLDKTVSFDEKGDPVSGGSSASTHSGGTMVTSAGDGGEENLAPPDLPGYTIIKELGRGGMGVVYLARQERHDRDVALKTLQRISPVDLQRFKQEFRSLADIAHTNLASLYELLSDGRTWCFSMEILEGVELLEYIWSEFHDLNRDKSADVHAESLGEDARLSDARRERLFDVLTQLAVGLNALHQAGMLHRDIKPSNVMVTTDGRLVLLDFGLVAEMQEDERKRGERGIQGTPEYMSPEQAACAPMTDASDWYSVGCMLYEILTGRLPITGKPIKVLVRKQTEKIKPPRELDSTVPDELNDLCMALLERSPEKRPSPVDFLRAIGAVDVADSLHAERRVEAGSVELVGRSRHLSMLNKTFDQVVDGRTRSVFVHGHSGMGKSVLVQQFLADVQNAGDAVVIQGRCYEQESVPFKALDSLIDSLASYLGTLPEDVVGQVMPGDTPALAHVFPVMGQFKSADQSEQRSLENVDLQELRQRILDTLRQVFRNLAAREPLVLYVDDLQWGDEDSATLFADLMRPPDAPNLLLLGSYRTENLETSSCLRALGEAYERGHERPYRQDIAVESLSLEDSRLLASRLLDDDDEAAQGKAERIARESGGWPFFVWELAQHVQDDTSAAEGSLELDEVIWTRANRLPEETRRLLELFAVAGRPMPATEAYEAIDDKAHGPSHLAQLRTNNFVRTSESDDDTVVETYHDRIRESVVDHLPSESVQSYSLNLAEVIEESSGLNLTEIEEYIRANTDYEEPTGELQLEKQQWQRVFDLASFFDAAGQPERAFPYALVAAEKASSQNALSVADEQFQIATRGAPNDALRFRAIEGRASVNLMRGQYQLADDLLTQARSMAEQNITLARIDVKLGSLAQKRGKMSESALHIEKALTVLGKPAPGNIVLTLLYMLKESAVQARNSVLPSWFVGRRSLDGPRFKRDMFDSRLFDRLLYAYWFCRGPIPTMWAHLKCVNIAERYPPTEELAQAYSVHGVVMTAVPYGPRGIQYSQRSYEIRKTNGNLWGQGQARSLQTFSYHVLGRFQEGLDNSREALDLLEQAGDAWEGNLARFFVAFSHYYLGNLREATAEAQRTYESGVDVGDPTIMAISLSVWAPAGSHTIPDGLTQQEVEREREDPLAASLALQGHGQWLLLAKGQPEEAAQAFHDSLVTARRAGLRNVVIFCGAAWRATARRIAALREDDPRRRRKALRSARWAADFALWVTSAYQTSRPHALRERGLLAVIDGHERTARRYLNRSIVKAEQQGARYEYAKSLLARAEAAQRFGWEEHANELEEAQALITGLVED